MSDERTFFSMNSSDFVHDSNCAHRIIFDARLTTAESQNRATKMNFNKLENSVSKKENIFRIFSIFLISL